MYVSPTQLPILLFYEEPMEDVRHASSNVIKLWYRDNKMGSWAEDEVQAF